MPVLLFDIYPPLHRYTIIFSTCSSRKNGNQLKNSHVSYYPRKCSRYSRICPVILVSYIRSLFFTSYIGTLIFTERWFRPFSLYHHPNRRIKNSENLVCAMRTRGRKQKSTFYTIPSYRNLPMRPDLLTQNTTEQREWQLIKMEDSQAAHITGIWVNKQKRNVGIDMQQSDRQTIIFLHFCLFPNFAALDLHSDTSLLTENHSTVFEIFKIL